MTVQHFETRFANPWLAAATVFCISVVAALAFRGLLPAPFRLAEFSDYTNHYEPVARNILAGRGITTNNGAIATFYGPGFPVILSGLFAAAGRLHTSEDAVLLGLMLACNGLTAVFIFLMARSLWPPFASLTVAVLWITYPFNLWFMQHPASEHPFMVLLSGTLYLFWLSRVRGWGRACLVVCGILFGLAALIRPIGIGLGAIAGLLLLFGWRERGALARVISALCVTLAFAAVVLPWIVSVHGATGQWIPIASSGHQVALSGLTYAFTNGFHVDTVPPEILSLQSRILANKPTSFIEIGAVLFAEFRRDPPMVGAFLLLKAARSWYGTFSGQFETVAIIVQIPYLALCLLSLINARRLPERARWMLAAHWLLIAYFWAMSTLVDSNLRYMAPVTGLVMIFIPVLVPAMRMSVAD